MRTRRRRLIARKNSAKQEPEIVPYAVQVEEPQADPIPPKKTAKKKQ